MAADLSMDAMLPKSNSVNQCVSLGLLTGVWPAGRQLLQEQMCTPTPAWGKTFESRKPGAHCRACRLLDRLTVYFCFSVGLSLFQAAWLILRSLSEVLTTYISLGGRDLEILFSFRDILNLLSYFLSLHEFPFRIMFYSPSGFQPVR